MFEITMKSMIFQLTLQISTILHQNQ